MTSEQRRASAPAAWACVHGYTMPHADTLCPHCCPLAWRAKSSPGEHVGPLGNEVTCEWIDRHVDRLETSVKEATDESERLREEWADARDGTTTYSRDEHIAALEALEDSAMSCAAHLIAKWLRRYADEHSGSHPANAGHIACNAAATELETGRAKWKAGK